MIMNALIGVAYLILFPLAIMFMTLWFRFIIVLADTLSFREAWNDSFALINWVGKR